MNICKDCKWVDPYEREWWCQHPRFDKIDFVTGERITKKCVDARVDDIGLLFVPDGLGFLQPVEECFYFEHKWDTSNRYKPVDNKDEEKLPPNQYKRNA